MHSRCKVALCFKTQLIKSKTEARNEFFSFSGIRLYFQPSVEERLFLFFLFGDIASVSQYYYSSFQQFRASLSISCVSYNNHFIIYAGLIVFYVMTSMTLSKSLERSSFYLGKKLHLLTNLSESSDLE